MRATAGERSARGAPATGRERTARRLRPDGSATRVHIVETALASLRDEGYAGATARSIAARGGFNAALIFYHFGGVDDLFLAALERTSTARLARYREALAGVDDLVAAVRVLHRLYTEDLDAAHIAAVQELVAASAFSASMRPRIVELLEPWFVLSEELVARVLRGSTLTRGVRAPDVAFGMVAVYLGLETMTRLTGGDAGRVDALFTSAEHMARRFGPLLTGETPRGGGPRRPRRVALD